MRTVLLRFIFDPFWSFQSVGNELLVGVGWLLIIWFSVACGSLLMQWRRTGNPKELAVSVGFWSMIPTGLLVIFWMDAPPARDGIPVFGYGFMMFVGFLSATLLAVHHAKRVDMDPNVIWDLMLWLLIPGLIGARAFYVLQYPDRIFGGAEAKNPLLSLVALWDGGLVYYGSVIGGALGGWLYCRRCQIRPLELADIVAPSLLVGLGFGRIGCFLYGCCFGGACDLPWAVQFPPGSLVHNVQVDEGIIPQGAPLTIPLHPTQIYSSLLAFLLAGVLIWAFRNRRFEGFVLGLMLTLYPVNRFILELIRNDEKGQLGTALTISQLISIAMFISGITLLVRLSKRSDLVSRDGLTKSTG